ncbi:hypothetical protein B0H63DRAFT_316742 [Podospora didyma]|uniref:Uncharacterized protein n=1 Tax=Podospora didyma TaxID=330526 RepID=A0AAE0N502_9PEZI|nr:hypothetical protein B0H63DRAFT_316742 [Podospora didyma]
MADARVARIVTAATFVPAFPLCIAHGVLSHNPVPAVGLAPLAFSAAFAIFLLSRGAKTTTSSRKSQKQPEHGHHHHHVPTDPEVTGLSPSPPSPPSPASSVAGEGTGHDVEAAEPAEPSSHEPTHTAFLTHPIFVFLVDVGLAAALMVVLVFTWIRTRQSYSSDLAMLASYATMPLLINFSIHLFLATRAFIAGLALHGLIQWTAWQAVPPDCPHCGLRVRPESLPVIPWLQSVSAPKRLFPRISVAALRVPRPSLTSFKSPSSWGVVPSGWTWKTPAWLQPRPQYTSLFVSNDDRDDDVDDDAVETPHPRYRDDPDEPIATPSSAAAVVASPVVEAVVVGKKDKKGKNSSSPAIFGDDEAGWP